MSPLPAITVETLREWRTEGRPYLLLDVRRDEEVAQVPYPNPVLHIEMTEVPQRIAEIPQDITLVVGCRSGGRSGKITEFLISQGYAHVHNLTGGILAWTETDGAACQI
jgi:rhodanese-related sulfurtransferase